MLLVLALDAGAVAQPLMGLREAALAAAAGQASPIRLAMPSGPRAGPDQSPPPCSGDVCQPQVSVPGYDPKYSTRGLRTRLTLRALDAMRLEPVATVAWWIATSGVNVDYTPRALDSALHGGVGVSRLRVTLRWTLDAWGAPVWLERPPPGAR